MKELLIVLAFTCVLSSLEYTSGRKMSWYISLYWFITSLCVFCSTIYYFINWISIIAWVIPLIISSWNMVERCSEKLDSLKWFK